MPEITVNGKRVTIREHFPAREFWNLPQQWAAFDGEDFDEWARIMGKFITSWEFDGEPTDPVAWGTWTPGRR